MKICATKNMIIGNLLDMTANFRKKLRKDNMTLLRRLWVKKYSQKGATFGDADDGFANSQRNSHR
jgi:hypothetical protein